MRGGPDRGAAGIRHVRFSRREASFDASLAHAENAALLSVSALSLSLTLVLSLPGGSDWPQFRGPDGTGAVPAADIPLEWGATKNLAWKAALPGEGWSQPVVVGGTVYVTAAVGTGLEK